MLTDLREYARDAKDRGDDNLYFCLKWTLRWQHVSDQTLAAFLLRSLDTNRPRYGYDLYRRGFLRRHEVAKGYRVTDGRYIYSLSKVGLTWLIQQGVNTK